MKTILGTGILTWDGHERRCDRIQDMDTKLHVLNLHKMSLITQETQ